VTGSDIPAPASSQLRDVAERWPVLSHRQVSGAFVTLRTDEVQMPDGDVAARDVVEHPGAVAVVALDDAGRVLMIRQYRHPVGRLLWEIPAGLRDIPGEPLRAAAERELREETGWGAKTWHVLIDYLTSPGILTERVRVYLARDVSQVPEAERGPARQHEEAYLLTAWVPLEAAVAAFLRGELHNGVTAVGILAAYAARQGGFARLREAGAREDLPLGEGESVPDRQATVPGGRGGPERAGS
jgi:8-oxo-dGTP pyrophosphatase MutT (NUDIX family)